MRLETFAQTSGLREFPGGVCFVLLLFLFFSLNLNLGAFRT